MVAGDWNRINRFTTAPQAMAPNSARSGELINPVTPTKKQKGLIRSIGVSILLEYRNQYPRS